MKRPTRQQLADWDTALIENERILASVATREWWRAHRRLLWWERVLAAYLGAMLGAMVMYAIWMVST